MKISNTRAGFVLALSMWLFLSLQSVDAQAFTYVRDLTLGSRGDDVSMLQQFLIEGAYLKIPASTGYFGPLTQGALGAWQASLGVFPPAGYFGPISRAKINSTVQPMTASQTQTIVTTTTVPASVPLPSVITYAPTAGAASPIVSSTANGSPVRFKIPKLGVDAGFQYTGISTDGVMEIPTNITDVGWFTGSVRPGEKGVAIITGHVAQMRGGVMTKQGVFYNLNELSAGDTISVENDKGETKNFVVREIKSYDPAANTTDVFTSTDGGTHMNLITCEGTWNPTKQSYSQRLVVFTDLVR